MVWRPVSPLGDSLDSGAVPGERLPWSLQRLWPLLSSHKTLGPSGAAFPPESCVTWCPLSAMWVTCADWRFACLCVFLMGPA